LIEHNKNGMIFSNHLDTYKRKERKEKKMKGKEGT